MHHKMCTLNATIPQPISLGSAKKECRVSAAYDHTGCVTPPKTQTLHKHTQFALWILHVTKTKAVLLNCVNSPLSGSLKHQLSLLPWVLFSKYPESVSPRKLEGGHTELYWGHFERRTPFLFVLFFFFSLPMVFQGISLNACRVLCSAENQGGSRGKDQGTRGLSASVYLSIT